MMCKHPYVKDASGMSLLCNAPEARAQSIPFGCGRCLPCKINKAREWTNRLMLEASCYPENIFLTLTYSDDTLPDPPNLDTTEMQKFLKRLRKDVHPQKLRYFAVGEYGDDSWRPYYHLAIFNYSPISEKPIIKAWSRKGNQIGHLLIGDLNKDSARYITGYCIKKLTNGKDDFTKEKLNGRTPEFSRSSTMQGGIGTCAVDKISKSLRASKHFNRNKINIIRECSIGGSKLPLGRYLTSRLASNLDMGIQEIKELYAYEEQLKEDYLPDERTYYTNYTKAIREGQKAKVNSMEKKFKIFQKKRNIL